MRPKARDADRAGCCERCGGRGDHERACLQVSRDWHPLLYYFRGSEVVPHMTLDPPPHTLGVIQIGLPESRLEMPFLPLDGELLHREGSEDGKQQKPHDPGDQSNPQYKYRAGEVERIAREGEGAFHDEVIRTAIRSHSRSCRAHHTDG